MHSSDPRATNVLARLFSYTPRSELRTPIEDFCTEALAWCLISCDDFARDFLANVKENLKRQGMLRRNLEAFVGEIDVGTQLSFEVDPGEEETEEQEVGGGRFDLVIRPQLGPSFIIVIESKTTFDRKIGSQLSAYRDALRERQFIHYQERYVISLTPWRPQASKGYARLTWQEVHKCLDDASAGNSVVRQFADFLHTRSLSKLSLMKLETEQLGQLQRIGPFFEDARRMFGRFQNEPKLRAIFKRHTERPILEHDKNRKSLFWGIYSGNRNPWAYAGLWLRESEILLYVQFMVDGDRRAWRSSFPSALAEAAREAVLSGREPEMENHRTSFFFVRKLTENLAAKPEAIFYWLQTTAESAEEFLQKKIASAVS